MRSGADALGFVFAEEARQRNRYIEPERAEAIIAQLPPFVTTVAVCVNATLAELRAYLAFADLVQLCGEEDAEAYRPWRTAPGGPRRPRVQPRRLTDHPARAIVLIRRHLEPMAAPCHVGLGSRPDRRGTRQPVILLRPDSGERRRAVRTVRPYAVDTSGGVEAAPGKKDHDRIRQFIRNARSGLSVS